jgi:hypothetical protein
MDPLIFIITIAVATTSICMSVATLATEIGKLRIMLQEYCQLDPIQPKQGLRQYKPPIKRKSGVEL